MDTKRLFKQAVNLVTLASFLVWNLSVAVPEGGSVAQGSAAISQSGTITTVNQTSQNAVINWQSFNTASNESVKFNQPNSSAVALNRINNGLPTQFAGQLNANGNVWILNPAGVLFTSTAKVDVAGLLATTHSISDADFIAGNYKFNLVPGSEAASIINNGLISAKDSGIIALVAPHVQNNGLIQVNLGKVSLSSGASYVLDMYGDQLINFGSNAPIQNGSVSNAGQIIANGGKVYMTANYASGVLDNMISMSGSIQAKSVSTNAKGEIVLFGGNPHTKKVAGVTKVSGKLDTSDSTGGSNGGFIETSGHEVDLVGADIQAGVGGKWLLDPTDIIVDGALAAIIAGQLTSGTNVTLDTTSGSGDAGDIIISSLIVTVSGTGGLTLFADNNILINSLIDINGSFTATAGNKIQINADVRTGGIQFYNSPVELLSSHVLTSMSSDIILSDTVDGPGALSLSASSVFLNAPIGVNTALDYFQVFATTACYINASTIITSHFQSYGSYFTQTPVILKTDVSMKALYFTFYSIDGDGLGAWNLDVDGAEVSMLANIGANAPLNNLSVSAFSIFFGSPNFILQQTFHTLQAQNYVLSQNVNSLNLVPQINFGGGESYYLHGIFTASSLYINIPASINGLTTFISIVGDVNLDAPVALNADLNVSAADRVFFTGGVTGPYSTLSAESLNPIYGPTGEGITGTVNVDSLILGGPGGAKLSSDYPIHETFVNGVGGEDARSLTTVLSNLLGVVYCINGFDCGAAVTNVVQPNIPPTQFFKAPIILNCSESGCANVELVLDNIIDTDIYSCTLSSTDRDTSSGIGCAKVMGQKP